MATPTYNEPSVLSDGSLTYAFRRLREGLIPFMRKVLNTDAVERGRGPHRREVKLEVVLDVNELLNIWLENQGTFIKSFSDRSDFNPGRNWPNEIRTFRNERWAHQGSYNDEDVANIVNVIILFLDAVEAKDEAGMVREIADEFEALIYSGQPLVETNPSTGQQLSVAEVAAGLHIDCLLPPRAGTSEPGVFADGFLARAWRRLAEGLGPHLENITGEKLEKPRDLAEILNTQHLNRFGQSLKYPCSELKEHRDQWAHQGNYEYRAVQRTLTVIRDVLKTVCAHERGEAVEQMAAELARLHRAARQRATESEEQILSVWELSPVLLTVQPALGLVAFQRPGSAASISASAAQRSIPIDAAAPIGAAGTDEERLREVIAECTEVIRRNPTDAAAYLRRGQARGDLGDMKNAAADFAAVVRINPNIKNDLEQAEVFLTQGNAHANTGNYDQAINCYNNATQLNPRYALAYFHRGLAHALTRDYELAIADFTDAIGIDENFAVAYDGRGNAHIFTGDYERAIADYTAAIGIDANFAAAYHDRGNVHMYFGDYERAIADCTAAIGIDANFAFAYNGRGIAHANTGDYERAVADYTTAIGIDANFAAAYNGRGIAHANTGDYERAIADYTTAIGIDANFAAAYNGRGIAHANIYDYERAIADYTAAIGIDENFAVAYNGRGIAHADTGDYERAIADYTTAIGIDANFAVACYGRGIAHANIYDYERAIADFTAAIGIDANFAFAYDGRGIAHANTGDYERAIADYTTAIGIDANFAFAYIGRGNAHANTGDYERAVADYTAAIGIDANFAAAYNGRGNAHANTGDYERAVADYTAAIGIDANCAAAYIGRCVAHANTGDYERVIADMDRVIELVSNEERWQEPLLRARHQLIRYLDGVAECDQIIKDNPDDPDGWHLRGLHYLSDDNYARAISDFDEAIRLNTENAEVWNDRGLAYTGFGDDDRAISDYDRAAMVRPNFPQAYYNKGLVRRGKGDYGNAIIDFTKAIRFKPDYALAYQNRGISYFHLGQRDLAQADFDSARQLGVKP